MKIVVIGGTGLIASKTVTGEGLKEAMAGAQVVIDLADSRSPGIAGPDHDVERNSV
jgi:hypothetical protein